MNENEEPAVVLRARVPRDMTACLDELARITGRDRNSLVLEAMVRYMEEQHRQIAEIKAGVQEANAGSFASDEAMDALWTEFGLEQETASE